jgi:hypothetical protein
MELLNNLALGFGVAFTLQNLPMPSAAPCWAR